jgi:rare lipoprotein A
VRRAPPLALVLLLASGCGGPRGGGYYEDDGPHVRSRDVSRVPDAVPRAEPRSAGGNRPYVVFKKTYHPLASAQGYRERGVASWYGKKFHGRRTSNGEQYDMYAMSAAHKTLPLPSYVRVRNLNNGNTVIVRVNDRGPFLHNRLIDLSYAAAARLGIVGTGTGLVEIESVDPDASTPTPAADTVPAAGARPTLYVQAGAFTDPDNAERLRARLTQARFAPVRIVRELRAGTTYHRVRIGPVSSIGESDGIIARITKAGIADDAIVTID